ncbi:MAG TPA: aminotransferase class V-fold PLP-dependent enzyme [Xanthomonadales bacterium]|nr:aminotransferase class V-fold PLP-dependent enzyme [Xanthomonadales bacterium]
MTQLDLEFVRSQFPAFREPSLEKFLHFENAGGSFACAQVIERLNQFYRASKVQPYYVFEPSRTGGQLMDQSRERLAAWMNASPAEISFGPSTSQNTYVLSQALRQYLSPGDEVIVTNQDHEANIGAWRRLADSGMVIREWQVDPDTAELGTEGLKKLLNGRTRVVAFTHCSNVVASVNPVREWVELIHEAKAWALVDGVSYAPHALADMQELGVDAYFYSLYKVFGPHLGVMYLRKELIEALPNQGHYFNAGKPTYRFTPAGPDHAQVASVNGVLDYLESVYSYHFAEPAPPAHQARAVNSLFRTQEQLLLQPLLDYLHQHPEVRLIGRNNAAGKASTVAFTAENMSSAVIAQALADRSIGVGVGDFYARRLVEALGIDPADGAVRLSFVHYTHADEVRRLIEALDEILG